MKINSKILSIPPYISTSWKNIASLHIETQESTLFLVVTLLSGARIEVPDLEFPMIETIFAAHTRYMELEEKAIQPKAPRPPIPNEQMISFGIPLKNALNGMENFGAMLNHNPEQANSPDLPPDVIDRIAQLSKTLGIDDSNVIPKPEPHCNCMHCQIARAIQDGCSGEGQKQPEEEIVSDEDLKFKSWDIIQTGDNLYVVSNPLDSKEQYNVFLGDPVGCTCGHTHCEHIRAVLNS